jgi:hypothetical protein
MNADADGGFVEEPVDDVELCLERREGLERAAERHVGSGTLGPPVFAVDAVTHEHGSETLRETSRRGGRCDRGPCWQRVEERQRHQDAGATQEIPAGNRDRAMSRNKGLQRAHCRVTVFVRRVVVIEVHGENIFWRFTEARRSSLTGRGTRPAHASCGTAGS